MKKSRHIPCIVLCALLIFLAGCASTSGLSRRDPTSFFSQEHDFYLSLSASENPDLARLLLKSFLPEISDKDAATLISHLRKVYIGITLPAAGSRELPSFELSAEGQFPSIMKSLVFSEKNGWEAEKSSVSGIEYYSHRFFPFEAALPVANRLLIALDIEPMLIADTPLPPQIGEALISAEDEGLRFYCARLPLSFDILPAVRSVSGSVLYTGGLYELSADLDLSDARAVRPTVLLLNLALGARTDDVYPLDDTSLRIVGLRFSDAEAQTALSALNPLRLRSP